MERINNFFQVDSFAKEFIVAESNESLCQISSKIRNSKYFIAGSLSNTLPPFFFDGYILKSGFTEIDILKTINDDCVYIQVGSGVIWDELVEYCVNNRLVGIENLSSIPGTVGGAVVQNIGAYGSELSEVVESVSVFDLENNASVSLNKCECNFSYRSSIFKNVGNEKFFITGLVIKLTTEKGVLKRIKKIGIINEVSLILNAISKSISVSKFRIKFNFDGFRLFLKSSLLSIKLKRFLVSRVRKKILIDPKIQGNCGCFFVCPLVDEPSLESVLQVSPDITYHKADSGLYKISACSLIKGVGMNGVEYNSVKSDVNKPVVLFNTGNATSDSFRFFSAKIQQAVFEKYKIVLEKEIVYFE